MKILKVIISGLFVVSFIGCNSSKSETNSGIKSPEITEMQDVTKEQNAAKTTDKKPAKAEIKVTFVELGSVGCIPCDMMKPIMEEIAKEYKDQVKVIFYDVRTESGNPYAAKYKIRVIPTQVFLDKDGKEFFRHEGFYPKEEIVKLLQSKGVK